MSQNKPAMQRREFLQSVSRKAPAWLFFLSTFASETISATEKSNGYKASEHDYAMGVDIHKCIGCGRCADACKKENHVPIEPTFFRTWVERYVIPTEGETHVESPNGGINGFPEIDSRIDILRTFFVPKLCNHCKNAPCVQVCPVGATFTSEDGVVLVDQSYCVGCRYCIQACPYGARYLHPETHVADKCTFCYHRITKGSLPACVEVCPTQARVFGEAGLRSSPLRRFLRFNDVTTLKPYLNTKPKVFYAGANGEVT
ncbi:MAG: 4Fe-4S dicluster domain-containing protein [candidate division Zixibacteria bacterium]